MIVEDQRIVAAHASNILRSCGYDVVGILHSADDMTAVIQERPDLVLMDINLSGETNGITAAVILRYHNIPVIFMTVSSDPEIIQAVKAANPFGFIVKPFSKESIYTTVEIALHRIELEHSAAAATSELENKSQIDQLTSAANREGLELQYMKHSISGIFGVLFIDIDQFKVCNDTYGHDAGDAILKEVATLLKGAIRSNDVVARFGGDEFVVLVSGATKLTIAGILSKVESVMDFNLCYQGHDIHVHASVGAAVFPDDGVTLRTSMQAADVMMYRSKKLTSRSSKITP